ncbi:MAG TPA: hypothetical protein PLZ86_03735 [bacterium]|nr:hypothetical protein [bacterium]HPQ80817.1 hypothetical protein [bacterium]
MRFPIFDDLGIESIDFDHILISFLPDRDKEGNKFSNKAWETGALKLQAELFRGATSYPRTIPSRGSYRTSEGKIILEDTKAVLSCVKKEELTPEALKKFSDFLKEFGQKTNQETVAFALDDQMHYIDFE